MKKALDSLLICTLFLLLSSTLRAQVSINQDNSSADPSSMLDVKSTSKGILIPRMSTSERTGINMPAKGLLVFDNTSSSFWFFNGTAWEELKGDDADADPTNELQALSYDLNTQMLMLSNGGTVDLSTLDNSQAITAIQSLINNHLAVDNDLSSTNELQDISLVGNQLSISNGSTVTLPAGTGSGADNLGNHTATQTLDLANNDLIDAGTLNADKIGIGTSNPDATLEIEGKLQLVDGTQGPNKILTSDADGNASWQVLKAESLFENGEAPAPDFSCLSEVGSLDFGFAVFTLTVSGNYAYVPDINFGQLRVIDVSDPSDPTQIGSLPDRFGIIDVPIAVSGSYLYYVKQDVGRPQLEIVDVSDPSDPTQIGSLRYPDVGTLTLKLAVSGNYIYAVYENELVAINVSNPSNPTEVGRLSIGANTESVAVMGNYLYIADSGSDDLKVIDVSTPSSPTEVGSLDIGGNPQSVFVSGNYVYVVDEDSDDLKVIDVCTPSSPTEVGSLDIGGNPQSVFVSGNFAYVVDADSDDLKLIDVSDPASPNLITDLDIGSSPREVVVLGNYAYVVDFGSQDLKVIQLTCDRDKALTVGPGGTIIEVEMDNLGDHMATENLQLKGNWISNDGDDEGLFIDTEGKIGAGTATPDATLDIEGKLQLVDGTQGPNKILTSDADGNASWQVLKAESLFENGEAPAPDFSCLSEVGSLDFGFAVFTLTVSGNYAYVPDINFGQLRVIDVSDPSDPTQIGSLPDRFGIIDVPIAVSGSYLYYVKQDVGRPQLEIVDVSDPSDPTQIGSLRYPDVGTLTLKLAVSGNYIYAVYENELVAINVSNPSNPTEEGRLSIGANTESIAVMGNYLYIADSGSDDLKLIDVSTPSNPTEVGSLDIGGNPQSVFVSGNYAYVVDADSDDLKVIDVCTPSSPMEVGSLDIGGNPQSVFVSGNFAYVVDADSDDLKLIDVSDPASPSLITDLDIGSSPREVVVLGNYAYVVDFDSQDLKVIQLSCERDPMALTIDPLTGMLLETQLIDTDNQMLDLSTNLLGISGGNSVDLSGYLDNTDNQMLDLSTNLLGISGGNSVDLSGYLDNTDNQMLSLSTNLLGISGGNSVDLSSYLDNTDSQMLSLSTNVLSISGGNSIDLSAYLDADNLGNHMATENLQLKGNWLSNDGGNEGLFVDTDGNIGAGTSTPDATLDIEGNLQLVDGTQGENKILTSDADGNASWQLLKPENLLSSDIAPNDFSCLSDIGSLDVGDAFTIAVSGKYAYIPVEAQGLKVIDVENPSDPIQINILNESFSLVDPPVVVSGSYLYYVRQTGGLARLEIVDLSDPSNPTIVDGWTKLEPEIADYQLAVSGNYAYLLTRFDLVVINVVNPLNLSEVGRLSAIGSRPQSIAVMGNYVYIVDSDSNDLKVIDVSTPSNPMEVGSLDLGGNPQSVTVSGNFAYVVDAGSDDLKVIDVMSDPSNPTEVGSLDIGANPQSVTVSGNFAYVVDAGSDDLKVIDVSNPSSPFLKNSLGIGSAPRSVVVLGEYAYVVDSDSDDLKIIDLNCTQIVLGIDPSTGEFIEAQIQDNDNQTLDLSTNTLSISGGNSVDLSSFANQTLNLSTNTLSISGGNNVDLSGYLDADNLGDHMATENLQLKGNWLSRDGDDEGIFVRTDGRVGIGTDSPAEQLSVIGVVRGARDVNETEYVEISHGGTHGYINTVGDGRLEFRHDGNTQMSLTDNGRLGIGISSPDYALEVHDGVSGDNNYVMKIENTSSSTTNRKNGLLIMTGLDLYSGGVTPSSRFVEFMRPDGTIIGNIRQGGSGAVAYSMTSDRRLKENIRPTRFSLADLMQIEVRDYNYKVDTKEQMETGFIAQQLHTIFPQAVGIGGDDAKIDPWTVDYGRLTPILVKAAQDLASRNEILEDQVDGQQEQIDRLEEDLEQVKEEKKLLEAKLGELQNFEARLKALEASILKNQEKPSSNATSKK